MVCIIKDTGSLKISSLVGEVPNHYTVLIPEHWVIVRDGVAGIHTTGCYQLKEV